MIGYARCSTREQNLDSQIQMLKEAGCIKIFQEKVSATEKKGSGIFDRPVLAECLQYLRPGDTLVVTSLDRVSRNFGALFKFTEHLKNLNVELKDIKYKIDTRDPMGKLLFYFCGIFSEMERDMISSRTKAGLVAARARGKIGGRRPKATKEDKEMIYFLYQNPKANIKDICKRFNITATTLYKYVNDFKREALETKAKDAMILESNPEYVQFKQQSMFE